MSMLKKLSHPFYLILLPIFFVLHGYLENVGFISPGLTLGLTAIYLLATICLGGLFWFFLRNKVKAALMAFACMCFFFFFGAILDFLKQFTGFLSHYGVLLPGIFIVLVILFIYLRRTNRSFVRLTIFLNLLFLVYTIIDLTGLINKILHPGQQKLSVYGFTTQQVHRTCDTCRKPNIYFLLMDEYASSLSLQQQYHFNNDIDSFLQQRKFRVLPHSRSNYNFTPFSMASILNMQYLDGIKNPRAVVGAEYKACSLVVRNNLVLKLLDAYGYDFYNYSNFDMPGHPALVLQPLLPVQTKLITDRTLFSRTDKDIGWLLKQKFPFKYLVPNPVIVHRQMPLDMAALVKERAAQPKSKPFFVYAHFNMPHTPYYFDKDGRPRDPQVVYNEMAAYPVQPYLDYVQFTNIHLKKLVTFIQQHDPTAVIMVYGDHGFRRHTNDYFPMYHFQNLNAVYLPNQDYTLFYDSITGVNQFRVLFNTIFHQQLPLLKDSCVYLIDKIK